MRKLAEDVLKDELEKSKEILMSVRCDPFRLHKDGEIPKIYIEGFKYHLCSTFLNWKELYIDWEARAYKELTNLRNSTISLDGGWGVLQEKWRRQVIKYLITKINEATAETLPKEGNRRAKR